MNMTIVETVNAVREVAWLPWVVQYFFLIGISYGAFLLSLPGIIGRRAGWIAISRVALLAALVCGLAAPTTLLADLHQPGRAYHFSLFFTPTSWMSWGSFFIPLYLGGLLLYAWLAFRPLLARQAQDAKLAPVLTHLCRRLAYGGHENRGALLAAAALTLLGATLVALYTGMEVMVVRARPLWDTPLLPLQFVVTALAGAIGLTLVIRRLAGAQPAPAQLTRALAVTQILALAIGALWLVLGLTGLSPSAALALTQLPPSVSWSAAGAALGALLTAWLALRRPGSGLLIGLLALHGAWLMRWTLFIGGQEVPKTGAGFYSYQLPLGADGLLGMVGTFGLCVALFIALTTLLPLARLDSDAA